MRFLLSPDIRGKKDGIHNGARNWFGALPSGLALREKTKIVVPLGLCNGVWAHSFLGHVVCSAYRITKHVQHGRAGNSCSRSSADRQWPCIYCGSTFKKTEEV